MSDQPSGECLVILAAGQAKRYGGGLKPLAPVGVHGEAILDLVASDALSAGFETLVLVLSPKSGPEIRRHIEQHWPSGIDVRFARQDAPRGTVDAVVAGWGELGSRDRFGVANADDLYGPDALRALSELLTGRGGDNGLVAFHLDRAVIGTAPVTRGVCRMGADGSLAGIEERRGVTRREDGTFGTGDGRSPAVLQPTTLVSMNLWAFSTALAAEFRAAMAAGVPDEEVLLPELVGALVAKRPEGVRFAVRPTQSRCVGVTHQGDLELVQADVRAQVEREERPRAPWAFG